MRHCQPAARGGWWRAPYRWRHRRRHVSAQEASEMYARSSTIHAQPLSLDEGIMYVREQTMPALMQIPGCIGLSLLVDREFGHCIATSSWESEDAMRASADAADSLRTMATGRFAGSVE